MLALRRWTLVKFIGDEAWRLGKGGLCFKTLEVDVKDNVKILFGVDGPKEPIYIHESLSQTHYAFRISRSMFIP